jgi:transcription initiation factor TFIID subunit 11
MQSVTNHPINDKMLIAMSGITKVFVGEVVETARTVMDEWNETGPIRPRHIREAYRRLKNAGKLVYLNQKSPFIR